MEHSAWLAEDMSQFHELYRPEYGEAEHRAYRALGDAARDVQRTIDPAHKAEAVAIHAIVPSARHHRVGEVSDAPGNRRDPRCALRLRPLA